MYRKIGPLLLAFIFVNSICDENWISKNLYCYYISENATNFDTANEWCVTSNSHLITVEDLVENTYIHSRAMDIAYESYWIGLKRVTSSIWRWTATGSVGNFFNWDIGEPDGEGSCARLTPFYKGKWRDYACSNKLKFICKKYADCGEPPYMADASIAITQDGVTLMESDVYPEGSLAEYSCNDGFNYVDGVLTKSSTCSLGGLWQPSLTTDRCEPKLCKTPPSFANVIANVTSRDLYDFGTVISYNCIPGFWFSQYETNVTKYLTCGSDKKWYGDDITSCSEVYCVRPITNNAIASTSLNTEGIVAGYQCQYGYKYYVDNTTFKTFTCGENGWNPPPMKCEIKRCPFHNVSHATPSTWSTDFDTSVLWQCNPGRRYPDTSTRKYMYCQENEEWNRLVTTGCERKKCEQTPDNNTETRTHNWNSTVLYKYEDELVYTCIEGWYFPDKEQSTTRIAKCDEDGEWYPKKIAECVGDPIEVKTVHYHKPKEKKGAAVYGTIGILLIGLVIGFIILLDVSTIGKHIIIMKANIRNEPIPENARRKQSASPKQVSKSKRGKGEKTVIDTKFTSLKKQGTKTKLSGVSDDKIQVLLNPDEHEVALIEDKLADLEIQAVCGQNDAQNIIREKHEESEASIKQEDENKLGPPNSDELDLHDSKEIGPPNLEELEPPNSEQLEPLNSVVLNPLFPQPEASVVDAEVDIKSKYGSNGSSATIGYENEAPPSRSGTVTRSTPSSGRTTVSEYHGASNSQVTHM